MLVATLPLPDLHLFEGPPLLTPGLLRTSWRNCFAQHPGPATKTLIIEASTTVEKGGPASSAAAVPADRVEPAITPTRGTSPTEGFVDRFYPPQ